MGKTQRTCGSRGGDDRVLGWGVQRREPKAVAFVKAQPFAHCDLETKREVYGVESVPDHCMLPTAPAPRDEQTDTLDKRVVWSEVFPWADREALDLLDSLLSYDANTRPSAREVGQRRRAAPRQSLMHTHTLASAGLVSRARAPVAETSVRGRRRGADAVVCGRRRWRIASLPRLLRRSRTGRWRRTWTWTRPSSAPRCEAVVASRRPQQLTRAATQPFGTRATNTCGIMNDTLSTTPMNAPHRSVAARKRAAIPGVVRRQVARRQELPNAPEKGHALRGGRGKGLRPGSGGGRSPDTIRGAGGSSGERTFARALRDGRAQSPSLRQASCVRPMSSRTTGDVFGAVRGGAQARRSFVNGRNAPIMHRVRIRCPNHVPRDKLHTSKPPEAARQGGGVFFTTLGRAAPMPTCVRVPVCVTSVCLRARVVKKRLRAWGMARCRPSRDSPPLWLVAAGPGPVSSVDTADIIRPSLLELQRSRN